MNQRKNAAVVIVVVLGLLVWLYPLVGNAAWIREPVSIPLNCNHPGETIGGYLDRLRPGDTLLVTGTCRENVLIPAQFLNITLNGQGTATIDGPDVTNPTVQINGSGITIQGFNITGGAQGIQVDHGGQAYITGNVIYGTSDDAVGLYRHSSARINGNTTHDTALGIAVKEGSEARIFNNTIERVNGHCIEVREGSSARIGINSTGDTTPSPNTISTCNGNGILVRLHSDATIGGNTISNSHNGVDIEDTSEAVVAGNTIQGNSGNGIHIAGSGLTIGTSFNVGFANVLNYTAPGELNGGYGIQCDFGGYILGLQGTAPNSLNGAHGRRNLDPTCINELSD